MTQFLIFLFGYACGCVSVALFAKDRKTHARRRQVVVLDPEQGGADPRVEHRSE